MSLVIFLIPNHVLVIFIGWEASDFLIYIKASLCWKSSGTTVLEIQGGTGE
jgi:hypothetical protein